MSRRSTTDAMATVNQTIDQHQESQNDVRYSPGYSEWPSTERGDLGKNNLKTKNTKRMGAGWRNWKKRGGALCNRSILLKLKVKSLQPSDQARHVVWGRNDGYHDTTIEVNNVRSLFKCRVTHTDNIRNQNIRGTSRVIKPTRSSRRNG